MLFNYIVKLINSYKKKKFFQSSYDFVYKKIERDKRLAKIGSQRTAEEIADMFKKRNDSAAAALCEIATFLINSGYPDIAEAYHKLSLKLELNPSTYSLYLQGLLLNPSCTEEKMYRAASMYDKLFLSHVKKYKSYSNDLNTNRKLTIGYICHFFHNCVSQSSLVPLLKAHDRNRVKVVCYSDADPTEVPDYVKTVPDIWRDTKKLDDEALASLIRKDKIDILLELNGHVIVNRYLTIARKPAPIQISYYNIATTTGISAIDYLIVGDDMSMDNVDPYYTESIYKFKGVSGVIKFPDHFPEVSPEPPCLKNEFITFGSFNAAQKVNKEVIKLWCKVLKQVPNSTFYMKAGVLSFEAYINSYKLLFKSEGIDLDRVHFEGFSEHHEMLKCYSKVDIALDTFPHCGATTTMEAIWQGVPVLSLYGERQSMQHGKAILESLGHPEFVAYSEEEFVNKAVELASDPNRLIKYRQQLREDFRYSPKSDVNAFALTLENVYYDMWDKYVKQHCNDVISA